eukprot:TRINITY_DN15996_c0_g1_i2.p1 TRINITY_DN15996_c0_g1~~TRINITY_DN15996_c0_g1_i2.p1  ORF type:complete len:630 (-),score=99.46 TRINITY_DN15996_c0_g1_i2:84-1973(-)
MHVDRAAFRRLLQQLLEQYEQDLQASLKIQDEMHVPGKVPAPTESNRSDRPTLSDIEEMLRPPTLLTSEAFCCPPFAAQVVKTRRGEAPGATLGNIEESVASSVRQEHLVSSMKSSASQDCDDAQHVVSNASSLDLEQTVRHIVHMPLETGLTPKTAAGSFVQSAIFDRCCAALLILNAVFVTIQVSNAFQPSVPAAISFADRLFCLLFILELLLRMHGNGCARFFRGEERAWNVFDFIVVCMSTLDTALTWEETDSASKTSALGNFSVLRVVRVIRVVRVLRVIRILRFFRDLRILIAAIGSTLKTASFALILIVLIMYMFGIALTQLVAEHYVQTVLDGVEMHSDLLVLYGSIPKTVFCLFQTISGGIDWNDAMVPLISTGPLASSLFVIYVSFMVLCVMNVLLGIFCQCALDTTATDRENVIQLQLQERDRFVKTLRDMFREWDQTGDEKCSLEEFRSHIKDEMTQALLRSLDIEGRDALAFFELLDRDGSGYVDLTEFITGCITLRGGAKAMQLEKVSWMHKHISPRLTVLEKKLDSMLHGLNLLESSSSQPCCEAEEVVNRALERLQLSINKVTSSRFEGLEQRLDDMLTGLADLRPAQPKRSEAEALVDQFLESMQEVEFEDC